MLNIFEVIVEMLRTGPKVPIKSPSGSTSQPMLPTIRRQFIQAILRALLASGLTAKAPSITFAQLAINVKSVKG